MPRPKTKVDLNKKERAFVLEYMRTGSKNKAAKKAGISQKRAVKDPVIAGMEKALRSELAKSAVYGVNEAMRELDMAVIFARQTQNATALVRAIEMKSKLMGLMIEKHQVQQVGFQIKIGGIDDPREATPVAIPAPKQEEDSGAEDE